MTANHSSTHSACHGSHLYKGGDNHAEQLTDIFSTCHQCHRAAYRGRHRMLVKCGHVFCDLCISQIDEELTNHENTKASLKCPLCHMVQQIPTKRLVNVASEAMTDRLLRRHNRAHGRADVFHDIRSYHVDPVNRKAAF